jgi:ABC-type sugar transport system ATPase subunit
VGARAEIYRIVRALAGAGVAVLLVSEDLPELLGLSDRLVVMRKGRVTATVPAASVAGEEAIVAHMT